MPVAWSDLGIGVSDAVAMFALLVSVVTAVFSISSSKSIASAEFVSQQQLKSDLAQLIAALRGIMHVGVDWRISTQEARKDISIGGFLSDVRDFMASTSGFAFYLWIAGKSKAATEADNRPEAWRSFFYQLSGLLGLGADPYKAALKSAKIERMLHEVTEADLGKMSKLLSDFDVSLGQLEKSSKHDPVIMALFVNLDKNETTRSEAKSAAASEKEKDNG